MSVEARITAALGSFGDPVEKSLLYAADKIVEEFHATKETKPELERFLNLFYMAVDAAAELKDMAEEM